MLGQWTAPLLNLKILDISQNLLVQLSETVNLHQVVELNLADNMLVDISSDNVDKMSSVSKLDLSYNKLSKFPRDAERLRELHMSGNMIKTLDQSSLHGLSSLQVGFTKLIWLIWINRLIFSMNIDIHSRFPLMALKTAHQY